MPWRCRYLQRLDYSFEASKLWITLGDLLEEAALEAGSNRAYIARCTCPEFGSEDTAEQQTRLEKLVLASQTYQPSSGVPHSELHGVS